MRRLALVLAVGLSTVLGACATLNVGSYVQRDATFAPYHTYAWGEPDALPAGDPRLDNNPFFKDYVEGAVNKEFVARGLTLASPAAADLLVHYHISVNERLDVNGVDRDYGFCLSGNCEPRVDVVEAGTLVIDVHDTRTKNLLWRGWAQDFVEAALSNQDVMEQQFTRQVRKMMAEFPVRLVRAELEQSGASPGESNPDELCATP